MKKQLHFNITHNKGFNLIEILVTMLIMAIGLMGIAALQFKGLQYNHDAYSRSQVNFLAYDIADRIRLNRANASDYVGNYTLTATAPTGCVQATGADKDNDLACWRLQVFNALPPGSEANITEAAGEFEIELSWTDRGNFTHDITYSFQP
jgi:type IV pilus assembly protein PilV